MRYIVMTHWPSDAIDRVPSLEIEIREMSQDGPTVAALAADYD